MIADLVLSALVLALGHNRLLSRSVLTKASSGQLNLRGFLCPSLRAILAQKYAPVYLPLMLCVGRKTQNATPF